MNMNDFLEHLTGDATNTRKFLNEGYFEKIDKAEILRYGAEYETLLYYPTYKKDSCEWQANEDGEEYDPENDEIGYDTYIEGDGPWVITAEVGADLHPTLYSALKTLFSNYLFDDEQEEMKNAIKPYLSKSRKANGNAMIKYCDGSLEKFVKYLKSL